MYVLSRKTRGPETFSKFYPTQNFTECELHHFSTLRESTVNVL